MTKCKPGLVSGFSFAVMVVVDMDAREFVFMCGSIASHYDTALAHAMLHAVAVWADARGVTRDTRGVRVDTRPHPARTRGRR